LLLTVYSHSLSIALVALFLASYVLHLFGSLHFANDEAMRLGQPAETVLQHTGQADQHAPTPHPNGRHLPKEAPQPVDRFIRVRPADQAHKRDPGFCRGSQLHGCQLTT
jgi:hypothetical protein